MFALMVSTMLECAIWMGFYILINIDYDILIFIGLVETFFFAVISHIILFFGVSQTE